MIISKREFKLTLSAKVSCDFFLYPPIYSRLKFLVGFVFLLVEEETLVLIHHLPVGLAVGCFFVSAVVLGCLLVVADCTSAEWLFGAV